MSYSFPCLLPPSSISHTTMRLRSDGQPISAPATTASRPAPAQVGCPSRVAPSWAPGHSGRPPCSLSGWHLTRAPLPIWTATADLPPTPLHGQFVALPPPICLAAIVPHERTSPSTQKECRARRAKPAGRREDRIASGVARDIWLAKESEYRVG